ncbi:dephospho-CoA kinase, partial [Rhodobacteraceae bacterium 4F10]
EKLAILNAIVHPVVNEHLQNFIKENSNKNYILYENAILFENGSDSFCDKIITVTAPENIRIDRVIKRDNSTIENVKNRIKNQWNETKKTLQSNYLIENLTLTNSKEQVLKIHNSLTKKRS